jgi:pimeloyl-ACP methyl ester carboxylesterase
MAKLKEGRGTLSFDIFKSSEMNWLFKRILTAMSEKGAEIGECLYAAQRINESDLDSWITEWANLAEMVYRQGIDSLNQKHRISARESFLRSMTYYRAAEYLCAPKDPRFDILWEKSRNSFIRACELFDPPVEVVMIPFEDGLMPGYFWRPANDLINRPTLISVGGNDDTGEESFLWNGPAAVRRGYNYFTFEYPGHRGCVHLNRNLVKRPDYEVPFAVAINYLMKKEGVDDRLALAGHSHGGYAVCRAAIYDKRIKALIPSTPLINADAVARKMFNIADKLPDSLLNLLINLKFINSPEIRVLIDYMVWTLGYPDLMSVIRDENRQGFTFEGEEHKISCPVLALIGENEGEELKNQAIKFIENISSTKKELMVFTLDEDASDDHCQLDNRTRANQVIFDWLDGIFL